MAADGPFSGHGSYDRRVDRLWVELQAQYEACGIDKRLANLTGSMLGGSGAVFPALHAKANECKHLLQPMLALCQALSDGSAMALHRIRAYECLVHAYGNIADEVGLFLSSESAEEVWADANEFVLHYDWLMKENLDRGRLLYNPAFKLHAFLHISYYTRYLHPRATWCYQYEDFIGRVKRLAVACARGSPMHRIPGKVMQQYRGAFNVAVSEQCGSEKGRNTDVIRCNTM